MNDASCSPLLVAPAKHLRPVRQAQQGCPAQKMFSRAFNRVIQGAMLPCMALMCLAVLSGCASRTAVVPPDKIVLPPDSSIADVRDFPQDLNVYARKIDENRPLLDRTGQIAQDERYNRFFFSPWELTKATEKATEAFAMLGGTKKNPSKARGYAENLLPWTQQRWDELARNANRHNYPSRADKAITVRQSSLREVPTHLPRFAHPTAPGQGFPFDLFQYSKLPVGMPLLITHTSLDGAWVFVETSLTSGWLMVEDTALVDAATRQRYKNGTYAAVLRDNVILRDNSGLYLGKAQIGTILPMEGNTSGGSITVLVPVRTPQGQALLVQSRLSTQDIAPKPLPLTAAKLAALGNPILGQPYGWGDFLGNRDCSSTMRDLFAPFGVWLPRNSASQAKAWAYMNFTSDNAQQKERIILQEGVPFATLLWLKGHIALYLGEYNGQAVMFHNMWGVRTVESGKQSGRHIVGRAVITSTKPGKELPTIEDNNGMLARIRGMSVLR